MSETVTYTHCNICVAGCGLKVTAKDNQIVNIEPDKDAAVWRDFCVRGAEAHHALNHPQRITHPMKRVGDGYVPVPYKQAIKEIAQQLKTILDRDGANALGAYTGNPGASNFGGFAFLGLLLDAVGTDNRYFVGSLDENAHHYVCDAMYHQPWTMLQADIENTDFLLLVGANPAISEFAWFFAVSEGWKKAQAMQARGGQIVVVDPRRSESAQKAKLHLAPLPDSDWALLLALLHIIASNDWYDKNAAKDCDDFEGLLTLLRNQDLQALSQRCDIASGILEQVARDFSRGSAMCLAHTGVGQSVNGAVGMWLAHLLNLITGNMRRKGGLYHNRGALDLLRTGAELFPEAKRSSRVNKAPSVAGYLPVNEMATDIATPGPGQIKAFIIQGGNPVISGPEGDNLDKAFAELELLIAVDSFQRDSHRHAHWLIPAPSFLEIEELSALIQEIGAESNIQMLRATVKKPDSMPYEWEFFRDLVLAMDKPLLLGKPALNWVVKGFNLYGKLTGKPYDGFSPKSIGKELLKKGGIVSYKDVDKAEHGLRLNQPRDYNYFLDSVATATGKVAVMPSALTERLQQLLAEPHLHNKSAEFPLQLISRRRKHMMNSWLTHGAMKKMKRPEGDVIEINDMDAQRWALNDGSQVRVRSRVGAIDAKLKVSDRVRSGVAVMSHGWGGQTYSPKNGSASEAVGGVNRNLLVAADDVDPLSRVPRLNGTAVCVEGL
ncbi:molybdopterin-dependent oxidoreductase [Zhongshania guokunii]|uniref:Molybdopterin-dependent oxidoreductase n=1 Tax=Zhongshania guokunii TaxID=641783 RepID=A0ABV3U3M8_9GAMM